MEGLGGREQKEVKHEKENIDAIYGTHATLALVSYGALQQGLGR